MGSFAWTLLAAPAMATAVAQDPGPARSRAEGAGAPDLFSSEITLSEQQMRDAAGGTGTAFDILIDDLGINIVDNTGIVTDVDANGAITGQITDNNINGNSGVTSILFNTGNGVLFQSTMQVNVFVDGATPSN